MNAITASELKAKMDAGEDLQLIDIREEHEIQICSIGGQSIPMAEILTRADDLRRDCPVVIHCRSGKRSAAVIHMLESRFEFDNLYNLDGGILG
ncbi:MAG: rhodanese-like domain-containing protein, partial [Flavobacteriales bacterium]|nr:rhodanese-like domain-containing protein [Flavobacteriales bacterium]